MDTTVAAFFSGQSFGDFTDSLRHARRNNNLEVLDGRCRLLWVEDFIEYSMEFFVGATDRRSGCGAAEEFLESFTQSVFLRQRDRVGLLSIPHGFEHLGQVINDGFAAAEPETAFMFLGEVTVVIAFVHHEGLALSLVFIRGAVGDGNTSDSGFVDTSVTAADMPYGVSDVEFSIDLHRLGLIGFLGVWVGIRLVSMSSASSHIGYMGMLSSSHCSDWFLRLGFL